MTVASLPTTGALPALDGSALTGVAPTKATIDALGIAASSITGALPAISGASLTNMAAGGKVVKMNAVFSGANLQTSSTTWMDAVSQAHTMQSSSNILVFLGIGSVNRGSQNGGIDHRIYNSTTSVEIARGRYHSVMDNDQYPIVSGYMSGYSGSATFKLQFNSTTNNNKASIGTGVGFIILEIDDS
jgi:hypothetical protein